MIKAIIPRMIGHKILLWSGVGHRRKCPTFFMPRPVKQIYTSVLRVKRLAARSRAHQTLSPVFDSTRERDNWLPFSGRPGQYVPTIHILLTHCSFLPHINLLLFVANQRKNR